MMSESQRQNTSAGRDAIERIASVETAGERPGGERAERHLEVPRQSAAT